MSSIGVTLPVLGIHPTCLQLPQVFPARASSSEVRLFGLSWFSFPFSAAMGPVLGAGCSAVGVGGKASSLGVDWGLALGLFMAAPTQRKMHYCSFQDAEVKNIAFSYSSGTD